MQKFSHSKDISNVSFTISHLLQKLFQCPAPFVAKHPKNYVLLLLFLILHIVFPMHIFQLGFQPQREAEMVLVKDNYNIHIAIQCHFYALCHSGLQKENDTIIKMV